MNRIELHDPFINSFLGFPTAEGKASVRLVRDALKRWSIFPRESVTFLKNIQIKTRKKQKTIYMYIPKLFFYKEPRKNRIS